MSRATVAILFYILTAAAAISAAAQAPAESPSPKPSKSTAAATPAKAPTVASAPRKAGPAAAPTTTVATSAPAGGDEVSIPPTPFATVVSPVADGPADAADADFSGAGALKRCAAVAGVAAAIATVTFY
ncbi:anther-specific protein BCP1 [Oryza sativa Japonica Group]|jgi:hypothetical protein|uniref:Os06g0284900 protein n=7 Tax=Oryza TaxID=4527 RepID=Q0DCV7_ORYSJ|nr:classical arabinogalactan protein 6 [Oryza sativa Japonica Group]XP_052160191.1 classical arabinogalactan protein 6-like [Oryza glaberrima]AFI71844.1 hypothetical protein [Oryza sativa Japonica Group]EAZ36647.1 hypothetical protein OsJ_20992 [Oryza sativa Japonica Group]KAF2926314.1 hypothetical protein DAI22_06g117400 [Oryza sativa Japonica Group]BAD69023.1 unknown protein [Oryza sativa Japonica Group]BAF19316.1 Os06g0284900 [Oryza sativa Japonica Group]|eukprot:NP_001057402.1 Os06g0284900 [Oryza sativa Japonica Group]